MQACSLRGHATYRPDEADLADRLHVVTVAGTAWRCLRCGDFVPGDPAGSGPADEAPDVLRGKSLRDAVILRLLAIERLLRAVVMVAAAYVVLKFRNTEDAVHRSFEGDLPEWRDLARQVGWNIDDSRILRLIEKAFSLSPTVLMWVGIALIALGVLSLAESVGLWLMKRWGEYLAVIATSVFLPFEIYELTENATWTKILVFFINVAAVVYLVWSKRLFGARGGERAFRAEHESQSLLSVERAALEDGSD